MKASKTLRKCYYRKFKIEVSPSQTLQQLLNQGLSKETKVAGRLEALDSAATQFRVIAYSKIVNGFLCGCLLTFQRGSYQTVMSDDPHATAISLLSLPPPIKNEVQQEYVPAVLYFAIFEDHVAVVQAAALRANAFENYLGWFLRARTALVAPSVSILLADEPQKVTKDRIRKSHVTSISIGRPFMEELSIAAPKDGFASNAQPMKVFSPNPSVFRMIKSYLSTDDLTNLDLEQGIFDGNLEVWLEIRYPKGQRARPVETLKLMDDLSIALRNQDEDSVELALGDGTTVKGSDLKLSSSINAQMLGSLVDDTDLFEQMTIWVSKLITDKMV